MAPGSHHRLPDKGGSRRRGKILYLCKSEIRLRAPSSSFRQLLQAGNRKLGYGGENKGLRVLQKAECNVPLGGDCWVIRLWSPSISAQSRMIPHSDGKAYNGL